MAGAVDLLMGIMIIGGLYLVAKQTGLFEGGIVSGGGSAPIGGGASVGGLSSASSIMSSGSMDVPASASGLVILIPNEGHEPPGNARMAAKNGDFLPNSVKIPLGCSVIWLSDDVDHNHTMKITGMTAPKSVSTDNYSNPLKFDKGGSFSITSSGGKDMKGTITVTSTPVAGTKTVGCLFVPTADLSKHTATLTGAGFKVESTSNFTFKADKQKHINNTCLVYSTALGLTATASKLTSITRATPYN